MTTAITSIPLKEQHNQLMLYHLVQSPVNHSLWIASYKTAFKLKLYHTLSTIAGPSLIITLLNVSAKETANFVCLYYYIQYLDLYSSNVTANVDYYLFHSIQLIWLHCCAHPATVFFSTLFSFSQWSINWYSCSYSIHFRELCTVLDIWWLHVRTSAVCCMGMKLTVLYPIRLFITQPIRPVTICCNSCVVA